MSLIEWWAQRKPHFRCPRCGAISFNPDDARNLHCGRCHLFFAPPPRNSAPLRLHFEQKLDSVRKSSEPARSDDSSFPTFPTSWDPPAAPDPPAFEPGGGSSGGGGASGDW